MAGWIPPRLRSLLGTDLDDVDQAALNRLIGLPEDLDLEFKGQFYEATEGAAKEAVYDVAAFANSGGGLIVIGVAEDGSGVADSLEPVEATERDLGLWIHQVVASRAAPPIGLTHRAVDIEGGFIHLLGVSPSIYQPHGVAVGDGGLRFPMRVGTTRRWLSEPEIADRYRRRLSGQTERTDALDSLHAAARRAIPTKQDSRPWAWLAISLIPDFPGNLEMRRGITSQWSDWVNADLRRFPAVERSHLYVTPGFRCLNLHDHHDTDASLYATGGRLHVDGGGFLLFGHPGGHNMIGVDADVVPIYDEHLVGDLVNGIGVLASHAVRSGASGDGDLSAELVAPTAPMLLTQYRARMPGQLRDTRRVEETTGISKHTMPLADSASPGPEVVSGARLLAVDLGSSFGQPEPQQVTSDIQLVRNRFQQGWHAELDAWAERAGVEVVPDLA